MKARRLNVLLTVDTELSPGRSIATPAALRANLDSSIYGTPTGEYGLPFQLEVLKKHGLKAVFFVEALSPIATGLWPLQEIVDLIQKEKQETQLHIHTEWLSIAERNPLGHRSGQNMSDFSARDQSLIIDIAKKNLEQCGVSTAAAFRAGNYGGNNDTLKALAQNGMCFNSSYNYTHLGGTCQMDVPEMLTGPTRIDGVWEVPITHFRDRPGGYRHAQICACSFQELSSMLLQAHASGMATFVIVSHSFELINRKRTRGNKMVAGRFLRLCQFLAERRDLFKTIGFNDLSLRETEQLPPPLVSSRWHTYTRYAQQLLARVYE